MGRLRLAAVAAALLLAGCTYFQDPAPSDAPLQPAPPAEGGGPAWRRLAPVPTERTEVAAAAVGRRIWVLGGYAPDGASLATAEVYDTVTNSWSRGPDLPVAVNHAMAAALGPAGRWPGRPGRAAVPGRRGGRGRAGVRHPGVRPGRRPLDRGPRAADPARAPGGGRRRRAGVRGRGPHGRDRQQPGRGRGLRPGRRPLGPRGRPAHGPGRPGRHRHRPRPGGGRGRGGGRDLPRGR